jgi:hypothetical protein
VNIVGQKSWAEWETRQYVKNIIKAKEKNRPFNEDLEWGREGGKEKEDSAPPAQRKVQKDKRFHVQARKRWPNQKWRVLKVEEGYEQMGVRGQWERRATRLAVGNVKRRNGRYTVPPEWEEERSDWFKKGRCGSIQVMACMQVVYFRGQRSQPATQKKKKEGDEK